MKFVTLQDFKDEPRPDIKVFPISQQTVFFWHFRFCFVYILFCLATHLDTTGGSDLPKSNEQLAAKGVSERQRWPGHLPVVGRKNNENDQ